MDSTILTAISTIGFPIVACIYLAMFCKNLFKKTNDTLEKVTNTNEILVETNSSIAKSIDIKIDNINSELKEVKYSVNKIKENNHVK